MLVNEVGQLVPHHAQQHGRWIGLASHQRQQFVGDQNGVTRQRNGIGAQHVTAMHEFHPIRRQHTSRPGRLGRTLPALTQLLLGGLAQYRGAHPLPLQLAQGGLAHRGVQ